jgi:E3 ubiquitin-protein ligase makorin
MSQKRGTKGKSPLPCKFFLEGCCTAGEKCRFLHPARGTASKSQPKPGSIDLVCNFFASKDGYCKEGSKCPYKHERPVAVEKPDPRKQKLVFKHASKEKAEATRPNAWANIPAAAAAEKASGEESIFEPEEVLDDDLFEPEEIIDDDEEDGVYFYGAVGQGFEQRPDPAASYSAVAVQGIPEEQLLAEEMQQMAMTQEQWPVASQQVELCQFFLQGDCRYGQSCRFAHMLQSPEEQHEQQWVQQEMAASQDLECGICFENVLSKGERFGLLTGCNHAFCLSCIRSWRAEGAIDKAAVRLCPLCRLQTFFIVPCNRMVTDSHRKNQVVAEFQQGMKRIDCKWFDKGRGTCPFGSSCFYVHRLSNGEVVAAPEVRPVLGPGGVGVAHGFRLEDFVHS